MVDMMFLMLECPRFKGQKKTSSADGSQYHDPVSLAPDGNLARKSPTGMRIMPRLTSFLELTWDEEKRMEEQIRNLNRRESMSIRCGDRMRARRRFRAGLLECCLGMFL